MLPPQILSEPKYWEMDTHFCRYHYVPCFETRTRPGSRVALRPLLKHTLGSMRCHAGDRASSTSSSTFPRNTAFSYLCSHVTTDPAFQIGIKGVPGASFPTFAPSHFMSTSRSKHRHCQTTRCILGQKDTCHPFSLYSHTCIHIPAVFLPRVGIMEVNIRIVLVTLVVDEDALTSPKCRKISTDMSIRLDLAN